MNESSSLEKIQHTALITYAVGNSTTRMVLWDHEGSDLLINEIPTEEILRKSAHSPEELADASELSQPFPVVVGGTVRDAVEVLFKKFSSLANMPTYRFRSNLVCPLKVKPTPEERVGDDRLAAGLGAMSLSDDHPWLVIDAGTALTIDLINPDPSGETFGIFEGGLILPGERMALDALHNGTDQLPHLDHWPEDKEAPLVGRSTDEAIRAGVRWGQLATLEGLLHRHLRRLPVATKIGLTGGGASALKRFLSSHVREEHLIHDPLLVDRGLFFAWNDRADD